MSHKCHEAGAKEILRRQIKKITVEHKDKTSSTYLNNILYYFADYETLESFVQLSDCLFIVKHYAFRSIW